MVHSPSSVPTWALLKCTGLMSSFWYNCRAEIPPKLCLLTLKSSCVNLLLNTRNEPAWPQSHPPCHHTSGCIGGIIPHPASVGCLNPMPHLVAQELTAAFFPVPLPPSISLVNLPGNLIILAILLKTPELPKVGCKPKERLRGPRLPELLHLSCCESRGMSCCSATTSIQKLSYSSQSIRISVTT